MKKLRVPGSLLSSVAIIFLLAGCVKDNCKQTYQYTWYEPVYRTAQEVRANIRSNAPREVENPGKIYIRGNYIFLNDVDRGIHVIDNSNPSNPTNLAFITIPGNLDLAVKGNTLYADLYTDLVAIDISDPLNVNLRKVVEGVFPPRFYTQGFIHNNSMIIAEWKKRDTVITADCNGPGWGLNQADVFVTMDATTGAGGGAAATPFGIGGSMARFTIMNERLYTVTWSDLNIFNITSPNDPAVTGNVNIGWNIETIYPFRDQLFIGSTSGMFIYSVSNPDNPVPAGEFSHVNSCDPVVADDEHAFVTLRSGTECQGFTNQLEILKLTNLNNPTLVKVYAMNNPRGLAKEGNYLFICDGPAGLKVYNATNPESLQLITTITNIEPNDVIAWNQRLLVVAADGLYQYDYSDMNNLRLLSRIEKSNE